MRKILFVDDVPEVLRMLERTLDPMKSEWDMRFVATRAENQRLCEDDRKGGARLSGHDRRFFHVGAYLLGLWGSR